MNVRRLFIIASVLLTLGAGCALDRKIDLRLPFTLGTASPFADAGKAAASITLKPGLEFTVRPSALGVSGSIDGLLGREDRSFDVRVEDVGPEDRLALAWSGEGASGTLALAGTSGAHSMLLPAFWREGASESEGNAALWLSTEAYDDLEGEGKTEWRLGLADNAFSALSKALKTFNDISVRLFGSATSSAVASPFTIEKTGIAEAFPVMIDGRVVLVRAVTATSWFADFVVLDNRDNPLILKVTVHPAAEPALKALEPADVRWDELGYEITSLTRP